VKTNVNSIATSHTDHSSLRPAIRRCNPSSAHPPTHNKTRNGRARGLTSSRPPNNPQLTSNINHTAPIPLPPIVRSKRLLLQHLLDLRPRAQPAPSIVDPVDAIELLRRRGVGALVVAQHTWKPGTSHSSAMMPALVSRGSYPFM